MIKNCALVLTSYPARLKFVPQVIETWMNSKQQPEKRVLYLSLLQYPNRNDDIPRDILDQLLALDVTIIYREGDERNFKSYYAGEDFPDWWLLQVDDDILPEEGAFDRFYEVHKMYPNHFITCVDTPSLLGSGVFYNASMLDKRYLSDMYKVVPLLLSDLWLSFWSCYAQIDVATMNPPIDRYFIPEANVQCLDQEYSNGPYLGQFQNLMISDYPEELEVAKVFAGDGAPWVKRKKKSIFYRIARRIYRDVKTLIEKRSIL